MTDERKNPYMGWSVSRLITHKTKIEEALDEAMLKEWGLTSEEFRKVHSRPECNIEKVPAGQKLGEANVEGVQFVARFYTLKCTAHNISSG